MENGAGSKLPVISMAPTHANGGPRVRDQPVAHARGKLPLSVLLRRMEGKPASDTYQKVMEARETGNFVPW